MMSAYRAILWSFLTQYALFALSFIVSVILARLLGPREMGIFSIAAALTLVLQNIQGFSLSQFIVSEQNLRAEHLRTAFGISIAFSSFFSLALFAGAGEIAAFYGEPKLKMVLYVLAASNLMTPIGTPAQAVLMREMRYRDLFVVNISAVVISAAFALWLASRGSGVMAQAWYVLAQVAIKSGLLLAYKPDQIKLRPSFEEWRVMSAFGTRLFGVSLTASAMARAPDLIVGRLVGITAVGLFSRAAGITDYAFKLLYPGSGGALFSVLAQRSNEGRDLTGPYLKAVSHFTGAIWPALLLMGIMAEPLITFLYGKEWLPAARLLQWLCLSQAILSIAVAHYEIPVIARRIDLLLRSEALHLALGLSLFAVMAWLGGVEGAAAGRVAHALIFVGINLIVLRKLLRFSVKRFASLIARGAAATAIAGLPALAVRLFYHSQTLAIPLGAMVAAGLLTAPAWVLGLAIARHPLHEEVMFALRASLSRWRMARAN